MDNNKIHVEEFSCYVSGIYIGTISFDQKKILFKTIDNKVNNIKNTINLFGISLNNIWRTLYNSKEIDWQACDNLLLGKDYHYSKYKKIKEQINGRIREGWIWASRKERFPVDIITESNKVVGFIIPGRDQTIVIIKADYENLSPLTHWKNKIISSDNYKVNFEGTKYISMRDGIKLATDIWLPSKINKKIPTILIRTPYGKSVGTSKWMGFVNRGYALVIQDVRGREDSEGEWIPFANEIEDGDDTINWIAEQSWSNDKVGMIGGSYLGYVQWAAAASGNPHLQALVSIVTAGSPFIDMPRKGGTFQSGILSWASMVSEKKTNFESLKRNDWDDVLAHRPIKDIPKFAFGKDIEFWNKWMEHHDNDSFWEKSDYTLHGDKINVPALIISGWYDDNGMGTTEVWSMNQKNQRENQKLILGPWLHNANSTRKINCVEFGNNSLKYDLSLLYLKWFDRFLKDVKNGIDEENKVEYYVVGENKWRYSNCWPPEEVKYENLYLHSNGNANKSLEDGKLSNKMPEKEGFDTYIYDPSNPCPYLIDLRENECSVPDNYKDIEKRSDVLVYSTLPLENEIIIAGDIYAVFYASSSANDTDWVVRLTDVDENGASIRLSDGILRARYRNSFKNPELIKPGKVEKYTLKMSKISALFKKGHRIRIEITSSADNLSFPNTNTGNYPEEDTEIIEATQKIFHGKKFPSYIKLPILKNN